MARFKFKPNSEALPKIMKSGAAQSLVLQSATKIKASADSMGTGVYQIKTSVGSVSAHARVGTTDYVSMVSNAKHNSLLKAMGSGGV